MLGMRAARGASRTPYVPSEAAEEEFLDPPSEAPEVEVDVEDIVEAESAAASAGPETVPAADALAELLRAGEALAHRLPEPSAPPAARTEDSDLAGADSVEPESVNEPPDVRPVLEEWLRGLRS